MLMRLFVSSILKDQLGVQNTGTFCKIYNTVVWKYTLMKPYLIILILIFKWNLYHMKITHRFLFF